MRQITTRDADAIRAAQQHCPDLYAETMRRINQATLAAYLRGDNDYADRLGDALTLVAHFLPDHEPTEDRERHIRRAGQAALNLAKERHAEDHRRTVALAALVAEDGFTIEAHKDANQGTGAIGTNNPDPERMTEPTRAETIEATARLIGQEHGPAQADLFRAMVEAYLCTDVRPGRRPGLAAPLTLEEGHATDSATAKTYRRAVARWSATLKAHALDLQSDPNHVPSPHRSLTPSAAPWQRFRPTEGPWQPAQERTQERAHWTPTPERTPAPRPQAKDNRRALAAQVRATTTAHEEAVLALALATPWQRPEAYATEAQAHRAALAARSAYRETRRTYYASKAHRAAPRLSAQDPAPLARTLIERPGAALGQGQESTPQASPILIGHAPRTWTAHPERHAYLEVRSAEGQTLYTTHDLDRYDEIRAHVLAWHTDAPKPWTPSTERTTGYAPDGTPKVERTGNANAERLAAAPRKGKPNTSKPRKVRAAVTGATVTR